MSAIDTRKPSRRPGNPRAVEIKVRASSGAFSRPVREQDERTRKLIEAALKSRDVRR